MENDILCIYGDNSKYSGLLCDCFGNKFHVCHGIIKFKFIPEVLCKKKINKQLLLEEIHLLSWPSP